MALHPYRADHADLVLPQGQLTAREQSFYEFLHERRELLNSPELGTLVFVPHPHDVWSIKATLIVHPA
jgi:hypothetical protein